MQRKVSDAVHVLVHWNACGEAEICENEYKQNAVVQFEHYALMKDTKSLELNYKHKHHLDRSYGNFRNNMCMMRTRCTMLAFMFYLLAKPKLVAAWIPGAMPNKHRLDAHWNQTFHQFSGKV